MLYANFYAFLKKNFINYDFPPQGFPGTEGWEAGGAVSGIIKGFTDLAIAVAVLVIIMNAIGLITDSDSIASSRHKSNIVNAFGTAIFALILRFSLLSLFVVAE